MAISDSDLEKLLSDGKLLEKKQIEESVTYTKEKKVSLYEAILEKDYISDENLGQLIADFLHQPYISLQKISIPDQFLKIVPENLARSFHLICFSSVLQEIKIASDNEANEACVKMIEKKTGKKATRFYTTPREVEHALSLYKKQLQTAFEEMLKEEVKKAANVKDEAPIIKIVNTLIEYAYDNKASDIHIEPKKDESIIRFRIDSILHDVLKLPISLHDQIISRIKVLSKLRTDEHMVAQDGKVVYTIENEDIDIRISIVPLIHGEDCVMRLLTAKTRSFNLSDLGIGTDDLAKIEAGYHKPFGMILSTGPTGSGKTTTMYAVLKLLNIRERNIATIEDPVEYNIEGISQIQVNEKTNLTFAHGLRSILRQDPDIIFVGEIRDKETVGIAVNSALTGHLVLSTLHTNDAATSLYRMIDMGVEPFLIATSVNTIIAQRLVRTICEKCKVSIYISQKDLSLHFPPYIIQKYIKKSQKVRAYQGKGCELCHMTGYRGRIGLFEVLQISKSLAKLITEKANSNEITKQAIKEGMTTMLDDGLNKLLRGLTTIDEIIRVTKE